MALSTLLPDHCVFAYHLLSDLIIRTPQPHNDWYANSQVFVCEHDAIRNHITERQTAENVDEDGFHPSVFQDDSE